MSAVYLDSDSTIEVDNLYYSFPNKFWIKDLEFKKSKAFTIYSSNIEISLDLYRLINKSTKSIARVNFKEARFVSYKGNCISLKNFLYKCTETSIALDTEILSDSVKIELLGLLETDNIINKIDTILNTFPDFDADQKQKHDFYNMINDSNASLNLYSLVFLGDNLEINISQDGSAGNIASDANAFVEVQSKHKQTQISCLLSCTQLNLNYDNQLFSIESVDVDSKFSKSQKDNFLFSLHAFIGECSMNGKFSGTLPTSSIYYNAENNSSSLVIINESDFCESFVSLILKDNILDFTGNSYIIPSACDIFLNNTKSQKKLIGGDNLIINFNKKHLQGVEIKPIAGFTIEANNFSVLESPPGEFHINGVLSENWEVSVENSFGKFGSSEATIDFSQKWYPLAYNFEIEGNCLPTDINSWMSDWWEKIWVDFNFSSKIPYGSFSIAGIWGQNSQDSKTIGSVNAHEFSYRGLPIREAEIVVDVESNLTSVNAKEIVHDTGNIKGNLYFPRKISPSPYFMMFDFEGNYPLNKGKNILGQNLKDSIADINATSIECKVKGKIADQSENDHELEMKIWSPENFTYRNFRLSDLVGEVTYSKGITRGSIDNINFADGTSNLEFDLNQTNDTENLSLKLMMNDVKTTEFLRSISLESELLMDKNKSLDLNSASAEDRMNLFFKAKGPASNLLQMEGSGKVELKHKNLSQINFLGPISSELSKLTFIPIGSFSFEKMNAVFNLDHEIIYFSPLVLEGIISKITSKGSLNLSSGDLDMLARVNLIGNFPVPGIKQIVGLADPISKITEFKVFGPWHNPKWKIMINPEP